MEAFLSQIEWVPVLISFVLSFGLGWLWYSPIMFYEKWRAGMGASVWRAPMWMPMSAQAGSTLLLAIIVNLAMSHGEPLHAILVGITIAGFTKANGFFGGKTMFAVSVETGFVVAMTIIMLAVNYLM